LKLSRREFLTISALSVGVLAARPFARIFSLPEFPQSELLGRVTKGFIDIKSRPDHASQTLGQAYEDTVLPWYREVNSSQKEVVFSNQRWVETPEGFLYAPLLQPVRNLPNNPVTVLPDSSLGQGMWVEVTVPYVDTIFVTEPTEDSWVSVRVDEGMPVRLYYSQVFWVDRIRTTDSGQVQYRVNPNYYGGIDMLWADARAFRPISEDELSPINPQAENKRIVVDAHANHQKLSCYEGDHEVYFCRVSTGAKYDMYGNVVDTWATPVGQHWITRKYISLQMSGGTTGAGYDLPGIGWSTIFATGGVAIHSTFWHNNFGDTMSHGCVNVTPEDAKWIFRWSQPTVRYDPGSSDSTVSGELSTSVQVFES
jgi:lipoprotein-anchoring transpeptidase ErfK/SrfK